MDGRREFRVLVHKSFLLAACLLAKPGTRGFVHLAIQHLTHCATHGHGSIQSYKNSLERDSASTQAEDKGIQCRLEGLSISDYRAV